MFFHCQVNFGPWKSRLVAIIKKELALEISLYTFLQILSVRPFEKTQISSAFLDVDDSFEMPMSPNQLNLF